MKKTLLMRLMCLALMALLMCTCAAADEVTGDDGSIRSDLTALEVSRLMGNGTNLGNTMEACNTNAIAPGNSPLTYEVSWGQPVTTQEMLTALKAAGFDTVRIPVAWMTNATTLAIDGSYIIDPAYLDRVAEIVDYARNAGMYVIINDHWDGGWWGMFGSESAETRQLAMDAYVGMWAQIAIRFADYSDYVIFESANEELGTRLDENSVYCSDSVTTYMTHDEYYALANQINQAFVDTVRMTGGNNAERFLLIAGFNTNIDQTCDERFKMPTDTVENKLLLSVHYYDPWSYAGATTAAGATAWGTRGDYEYMDGQMQKLTKFTKQGYGVVIGEYAALPGSDGLKANTVAYHQRFLDLCDYYDLTSCLWDCSGMFVRRDLAFCDDELSALYGGRNAASEEGKSYADIQAAAKASLDAGLEAAPTTFVKDAIVLTDETAVAWLMWNDGGWALSYSVGDDYNPDSISAGMKVTDVEITGPGTYTVGIDFSGTQQGVSNSVAFSALAIANGEVLFPGYVIDIKEVLIDGEVYRLKGRAYTTSDNGVTTRVNLYNEWVTAVPVGTARMHYGNLAGATPTPINRNDAAIAQIHSIYITFEYGPQK
ncbi:MAG: glycoside hydrolase family 5 protein [Clostridia bacterium]|nr:glycoside hydrolase family 5 protein [Clostridia bacterium]